MKKTFLSLAVFFVASFLFFSLAFSAAAYKIETLDDPSVKGDFVLGPGKTELIMDAGEKFSKELIITNRLGQTADFRIEIEDMQGSRDPGIAIDLLGEKEGPYSLRDYLKPEITNFTLKHNERIILPVEVAIPSNAEPGGRYGSVLVTTVPSAEELALEKNKAKGQTKLVSRLGTLFFIRIKGDVKEEGLLKDFRTREGKSFFEKSPIALELLFENNGNVHLMPYGLIEIKNIFGKRIEEINLDPWFVMPDSLRSRVVEWNSKRFLFGRYTATALVNRGYNDLVDQKSLSFWVIPWKIISVILVVVFLLVWLLRWVAKEFKFEVKRKK